MRVMITFVGILTMLGGIWPLISNYDFIPEILDIIPNTGPTYQIIIVGIGAIAVLYGASVSRYH